MNIEKHITIENLLVDQEKIENHVRELLLSYMVLYPCNHCYFLKNFNSSIITNSYFQECEKIKNDIKKLETISGISVFVILKKKINLLIAGASKFYEDNFLDIKKCWDLELELSKNSFILYNLIREKYPEKNNEFEITNEILNVSKDINEDISDYTDKEINLLKANIII